jgi:hypothetical protein
VSIETCVIAARQSGSCSSSQAITAAEFTAVDLREQPARAVQIDQAGVEPVHPHLHPGRRFDLVAALPAAGLVDAEDPHRRRPAGQHLVGVGDERVMRDPPVHAHLDSHPGHRPQVISDRFGRRPPGPGSDPGPRRDLRWQRLGEYLPLALRHPAMPFPLVPQQHWPIRADPHIPRPGHYPFLRRRRLLPARRAPPRQLRVGRTMHYPPTGLVDQHPIDDQSIDRQQQRTTLVHARGPLN